MQQDRPFLLIRLSPFVIFYASFDEFILQTNKLCVKETLFLSLPTCKNAIVSLIHGKYENNVVHRSYLPWTGLLMKSTSFLVVTVSIANVKFNSKQTSSIGIIAKDLLVATPLLAMRVPVAQWFIEHPNKNSYGRS